MLLPVAAQLLSSVFQPRARDRVAGVATVPAPLTFTRCVQWSEKPLQPWHQGARVRACVRACVRALTCSRAPPRNSLPVFDPTLPDAPSASRRCAAVQPKVAWRRRARGVVLIQGRVRCANVLSDTCAVCLSSRFCGSGICRCCLCLQT